MDKPLFPNDKNTILDQNEAKKLSLPGNAPDLSAQNNTTIGAYSPNSSKPIELSQKAWNESVNDPKTGVPWMNDWKSRMGVRAFSRGIMGAGFFVVGGMLSRKWMKGYDLTKTFGEQENKNALQFLAKSIDTVVGKPIEAIIKTVTGNERRAKRAVLFRSTYYTNKLQVGGKTLWGRSLGQEVIDVTFDFFSASVGDALGRDLISGLDPNVKKDWIDDKGHVDVKKAAGHAGKAVWRYLTYNGGEDWAVAIPYVYFMKWQRQYINNFSPGWKYDFDQDKKGGSFKLGGSPRKLDGTTICRPLPAITHWKASSISRTASPSTISAR